MTRTKNIQIELIQEATGCSEKFAGEMRLYMYDNLSKPLGSLSCFEFIREAHKTFLILSFVKFQLN